MRRKTITNSNQTISRSSLPKIVATLLPISLVFTLFFSKDIPNETRLVIYRLNFVNVPKVNPCNNRATYPNYLKFHLYAPQSNGNFVGMIIKLAPPEIAVYTVKSGYEHDTYIMTINT